MSILTDLIVFLFAEALKSVPFDADFLSTMPSTRALPDGAPSEFYRLSLILSPNG